MQVPDLVLRSGGLLVLGVEASHSSLATPSRHYMGDRCRKVWRQRRTPGLSIREEPAGLGAHLLIGAQGPQQRDQPGPQTGLARRVLGPVGGGPPTSAKVPPTRCRTSWRTSGSSCSPATSSRSPSPPESAHQTSGSRSGPRADHSSSESSRGAEPATVADHVSAAKLRRSLSSSWPNAPSRRLRRSSL